MEKLIPEFSTSTFYATLWTDDYSRFVSAIGSDGRYEKLDKSSNDNNPQYMLPYISRIFQDDQLYSEFLLGRDYFPELPMFESNIKSGGTVKLQDVRLCCFSTGCIFMEFQIVYDGLTIDEIANFAFRFKNANNQDKNAPEKVRMLDTIPALLPENAGATVFYAASSFKNDCKMFHRIALEEALPEEELKRHLVHLRRGYHQEFPIPRMDEDFDMIFDPYDYDHWAGSQEGLVNIYNLTDNPSSNSYLTKYKPLQLAVSYRFMYLILLNQRFSAIVFLGKIPQFRSLTRKERDKMSYMISTLKTTFSFSVVSDDHLYQTIYTKMYTILGIDRLLADVRDNEEQIQLLQNHELLNTEKMTSVFLFGLSVLSLFSVLVDAAGYFDRIPILQSISTILSALCLLSIVVFYLVWWIRYQKK